MEDTGYRNLEVYLLAHEVGVEVHRLTLQLPKFELYESGSQLRRSSKSISANIVEGFGRRRYKAEFVRFLIFAHASCIESQEWLEYVRDCHPDTVDAVAPLWQKIDRLGRQLNRFIQGVESNHRSPK